jgi:hypothetical protein
LFLVADAPGASKSGHTHVCEGCPFCSKNQEDRVAVVEFVDHAGKVLPYDAQQLFGVEHNQIVVVRGKPRVDELGGMVISASGLYIRR